MQTLGLRPPSPCLHGKRMTNARTTLLPGLSVGHHVRPARAVPSSESEPATTSAPTSGNGAGTNEHTDAINIDAHAVAPPVATTSPKPTAATSGTVEGDWLEPPPGDWGGTVDRQAIKEPDSSGVLFFFIIIAGLSLGVHQLLRFLGAPRVEEQLARPSRGQIAAVVAPASRTTLPGSPLSRSKPEASREEPAAVATATAALNEPRDAADSGAASGAQTADPVGVATAAPTAAQREPAADGVRGHAGPAGPSRSAQVSASDSEAGREEAEAESEETAAEESEPVTMRLTQPLQQRQQQAVSGSASLVSMSVPSAGPSGGDRPSSSGAAEPLQQATGVEGGAGEVGGATGSLPVEGQARNGAFGLTRQAPPSAEQMSDLDNAAGPAAGPAVAAQPVLATTSSVGGNGGLGDVRGSVTAPAEQQASPGPGTSGAGAGGGAAIPFPGFSSGAGAPFMSSSSGEGGTGGVTAAAAEPLLAELPPPARLSLPAVRPEPLARTPDSSTLALLPNDGSLGSLRERAQLALRASAVAVEASQRAAAYAAAASSAASRAAEAAERAATAATSAQAGLESAAESAIAAAEARAAQAAEAAQEAEGRAASAAAHAIAYQDVAQSQADIAERAAAVQKPAAPGPLSQLQQLWRSASSAFAHGHQPSQSEVPRGGLGDVPFEAGATGGSRSSSTTIGSDSGARGGSNTVDAGGAGATAGKMGTAAAETISSTVKGLMSWLGQGDGTR